MITKERATELVMGLSRTVGFPHDEDGLESLATGLQRAARDPEHAAAIIQRCGELSKYCPTDHDLLSVAEELTPVPAWHPQPHSGTCRAGRCDGHGWAPAFWIVTETRSGMGSYRRRERITEAQYHGLAGKIDRQTQRLYESIEPCGCVTGTDQKQLASGDNQ